MVNRKEHALEAIDKAKREEFRAGFEAGCEWFDANAQDDPPEMYLHLYQELALGDSVDPDDVFFELHLTRNRGSDASRAFWAAEAGKKEVDPSPAFAHGFLRGVVDAAENAYDDPDHWQNYDRYQEFREWGERAGRRWVQTRVVGNGQDNELMVRLAQFARDLGDDDYRDWVQDNGNPRESVGVSLYRIMSGGDGNHLANHSDEFWEEATFPFFARAEDAQRPPEEFVEGFIAGALEAWEEANDAA